MKKLKYIHEMIDFCAMAEIPAMHSHFGFIPEDPSSEQYKDFYQGHAGFGELCQAARCDDLF